MADDDVLSPVDDVWKWSQGAGQALVTVREECRITADGVIGGWCVDCLLHIGLVEVVVWSPAKTIEESACHTSVGLTSIN